MVEVAEQITVLRSVQDVWAVLTAFGEISVWASSINDSSFTTDQRDGAGTMRRIQVGRKTYVETVVEWQPQVRLGYRVEGLPSIMKSFTNTWELAGAGRGNVTTVTLTSRFDTGTRPPQRLIGRLLGRLVARQSKSLLAGLKTHTEQAAEC